MLEMIENMTNWYIRFNRKRLKGENGTEDTLHALNTLFELLFTIVRAMAPFTPFITDNIYGRLRKYIPAEYLPETNESVHYLEFPEVREELFDEVVERRFVRMKAVIDLARTSRERKAIGLKTPLKTLVVIHSDQQYLDDVKSLESYITSELNVHNLVLSTEEDKWGVEYGVIADWPVLGKKLKKDAPKVRNALPNLTSTQVKAFVANKEMEVAGVKIVAEDLIVTRGVAKTDALKNMEANTDNDVLTILDTELYPDLESEGLAREIINRVQRLRKKAGLLATDDIKMEYKVLNDPIGLEEVFTKHSDAFHKALRRPLDKADITKIEPLHPGQDLQKVILEEEQLIGEAVFFLRLLKL